MVDICSRSIVVCGVDFNLGKNWDRRREFDACDSDQNPCRAGDVMGDGVYCRSAEWNF